jgi:uncharacterized protein YndB with AHSA1/START domain
MVNIVHRVGIKAPMAKVYEAISTVEGVRNWWTREITGLAEVGQVIRVRFLANDGNELGSMEFEIIELDVHRSVRWLFQSGPAEWIGTEAKFELKEEGDYTIILFRHQGWREEVEFMAHCSLKWATFMLSLKELLETGTGRPAPQDVKIDNWN